MKKEAEEMEGVMTASKSGHGAGNSGQNGAGNSITGSSTEEASLAVHKLVLVAASPFFRTHLNSGSLDDNKFKLQIPQVGGGEGGRWRER